MFEINKDVILVVGAKNAAIYDLNTNNVYSINSIAFDIIYRLAIIKKSPRSSQEVDYISQLESKNLLSQNFSPKEFNMQPNFELKLKFAWLELTEGCNLQCLHCYEGNRHQRSFEELSTNQWKQIIVDLYNNGCERIQFTGGECFLRSDLLELLQFTVTTGIDDITVFTNASLLNDDIIDFFARYNIKIRVSLYGHIASIHDSITQCVGSFNKTINNINKMLKNDINITPAIVIMKNNENYIDDIKQFVIDLGLKYSGYDIIRNVHGGTQFQYAPTKKSILQSKNRSEPFFYTSKSKFKTATSHNTCWYGKIAITPVGKVIPCIFERNILLGDLKQETLFDILHSETIKKYWNLDFSQINTCKDCEYRFACKDCRPLSLAYCNNLNSKNPRCLYNPYTGQWDT